MACRGYKYYGHAQLSTELSTFRHHFCCVFPMKYFVELMEIIQISCMYRRSSQPIEISIDALYQWIAISILTHVHGDTPHTFQREEALKNLV